MSETITLHDVLAFIAGQPDDAVVGTACEQQDCVVARYVEEMYQGADITTRAIMTLVYEDDDDNDDSKFTISHDTGVPELINRLDDDAVESGNYTLTAGMVRATIGVIIRESQATEADEVTE